MPDLDAGYLELKSVDRPDSLLSSGYPAYLDEDWDDDQSNPVATWMLNFVLGLLGTTVVALAFTQLDANDSRYLYNPWTYAVLVPVAVVLLSALLSTLVSRIVRRSMQAAFLLSVLAHLLILTGLSNVVIQSRFWPELFDSLAHQRQQLKREQLQAKQYVEVSMSTLANRRPDHLRLTPSEAKPTELETDDLKSIERRQSLSAEAARDPLATQEPDAAMQRAQAAARANLLPRATRPIHEQSSNQPSSEQQDGNLSRSELMRPAPSNQATSVAAAFSPEQLDVSAQLQPPEALQLATESNLRRPVAEADNPGVFDLASLSDASRDAVSASQALSSLTDNNSSQAQEARMNAPLQRRAAANDSTIAADGASTLSLARSSLGGDVGPAARRSVPTLGSQFSAQANAEAQPLMEIASSSPLQRNRSSGALPLPGDSQVVAASQWDGNISLSNGLASRSPSQLAGQGTGLANSADPSGQLGSGGTLERAAIGSTTFPTVGSPLAGLSKVQAELDATAEGASNSAQGRSVPDNSLQGVEQLAAQLQRSRGNTAGRMEVPLVDTMPLAAGGSGSGGLSGGLNAGLSGLASSSAQTLMPRRSSDTIGLKLPELELQTMKRSELGGTLSAGKSVAMPAFQQRLDRLQSGGADLAIDPQSELAIERGLAFLAKYQRPNGSWRLQDFDTKVLVRSDTAATALALLAFQGAGYTHLESKYAAQVSGAIDFLSKNQRDNGDLYIPQDPASDQNAWLYSHAIAALALCEAYGMTQDEKLKPVAQKAIDFMVSSQDQQRGGWRYRPGFGSDTSVTGWYMMALQSGRLAGLRVPVETFDRIKKFVDRAAATTGEPYLFRYNPFAPDSPEQRHGLQPTAVMTSVGLLIRLYLGWHRDDQEMIDGATFLLIHSPQNGTVQQTRRDTYYWYYATQVIFHMGGDYWQQWHAKLNPILIQDQVREGPFEGSWDPVTPVPDLWTNYGGRLYVTTMNLLSLEVSYRHLPLYESTAK